MAEVKLSQVHVHGGIARPANTQFTVDEATLSWLKKHLSNQLTVISEKSAKPAKSAISTGTVVYPPLPENEE